MLKIGIKGYGEMPVTEEVSASHIGSGTVLVLATPMMILLMERTCRLSVKPFLADNEETVGTHVNVSHCAAVPVGRTVRCETEIIDLDRRRIVFKVAVYDGDTLVGEGQHERFVINIDKFREKMSKLT